MTVSIRTRSEQRLEQLEAIGRERRLTDDEHAEILRCEHAIYCRNQRLARRIEQEMGAGILAEFEGSTPHLQAEGELSEARLDIAEAGGTTGWPVPPCRDWQANAVQASDTLRRSIKMAGVRP